MEKNTLTHAGIKGMKWGVRRYQNKDGSLTPAGRKRYAEENAHDDYKKAHSGKSVRDMSDAELRNANNRLQMEAQYKNLTKKKVSKGRQWVTGIAVGAATAVASGYANKWAKKGAEYVGKKAADEGKKKIAAAIISREIKKTAKNLGT